MKRTVAWRQKSSRGAGHTPKTTVTARQRPMATAVRAGTGTTDGVSSLVAAGASSVSRISAFSVEMVPDTAPGDAQLDAPSAGAVLAPGGRSLSSAPGAYM